MLSVAFRLFVKYEVVFESKKKTKFMNTTRHLTAFAVILKTIFKVNDV